MCKIVSSMKSLGYEIVTFVCNDYLNIWTGQAVWESHFLGGFFNHTQIPAFLWTGNIVNDHENSYFHESSRFSG